MTWKRRLALFSLLAVLAGVGFGLAMALTPDHRPGVTKSNFDKLEVGMSDGQVHDLLGPPMFESHRNGATWQVWIGEDGSTIFVSYSMAHISRGEWKVADMTWTPSTETPWQRIRRLLRISV